MSFLAPVIGGVAGALFGGKDQKQTTANTLDPTIQRYRDMFLSQAHGLAGQTPSQYGGPLTTSQDPRLAQAAGFFGQGAGLIGNSAGILNGDPAAIARATNPFESQVIGGLNKQYDLERTSVQQQLADQATRAGAFGGDRYGVALGQGLGDTNRAQAQQVGGLQYQDYQDVMNRAWANMGIGLGAAGQLGQLGIFGTQLGQQNNQAQYAEWLRQQQQPYQQLQAMQGALGTAGALGGGTSVQSRPGAGILGGAAGGAMIGQGLFGSRSQPAQTPASNPPPDYSAGWSN